MELILRDPKTPIPWRANTPPTPFMVWRDHLGHLTNDAVMYMRRETEILEIERQMDA